MYHSLLQVRQPQECTCIYNSHKISSSTGEDIKNMKQKVDNIVNSHERNVVFNVPFPEPVKTKTSGQIPAGNPRVAISSPTEITAALAAAKDEYIYGAPNERNGVEYPRLRYP